MDGPLDRSCDSKEKDDEDFYWEGSEEESSTQYCSLSSEVSRNIRSLQRHQSVEEWLRGDQIDKSYNFNDKYFRNAG